MHPTIILILIICAAWFYYIGTTTYKAVGASIAFSFIGIVEFLMAFAILEKIMLNLNFYMKAIRSGPDLGPILMFIALPSLIVVILTGLLLKSYFDRSSKDKNIK